MDLLPIPEDPAFPMEDVPFVCNDVWDCGTFITYPIRTGQTRAIPIKVLTGFSEFHSTEAYDWHEGSKDHETVFQTWLFFGLMAEFLALNESEDGSRITDVGSAKKEMKLLMQECRKSDDTKQILIGRPFLQLRPLIVKRLQKQGSKIPIYAKHLSRCLNVAREMVCSADWSLREPVRYSVAALGETLVYTLRNICRATGQDIPFDNGIYRTWGTRLREKGSPLWGRLVNAGWCPGDVDRLKQEIGYMSAMHYAARVKLPPSRHAHNSCSSAGCVAAQIVPSTYKLMHINDECRCETINVSGTALSDILSNDRNTYPVLHIVKTNTPPLVSISVESREADTPFVAMSHVWADGLGNPSANILQSCQLSRLVDLVSLLETGFPNPSKTGYRIWLDTLCCPVEKAAKEVALQRMANVYRDASHVLVLDSTLQHYRFEDLSSPENYLRTFATSSWVKRLWTLQERAVDILALRDLLSDHDSEDNLGSLCRGLRLEFNSLQMRIEISDDPESKDPLISRQLSRLVHSLRYRSVSVRSDEAPCIATLLGLDPKPVLDLSQPDDRMQKVWEIVTNDYGGFPADSIFLMGYDTLSMPGWRWAPRTLLKSESDTTWSLSDRYHGFRSNQIGRVVPNGLEVCFPGWLVRVRSWIPNMRIDTWINLAFGTRSPIVARDLSSRRIVQIGLVVHGIPETMPEMSLRHLLASHPDLAILQSTALTLQRHLLARIVGEGSVQNQFGETDAFPLEFVAHIVVQKIPDALQSIFESIMDLAKEAARDPSSVLLSEDYDRDGSIGTRESDKVKQHMKRITARKLENDPEFRERVLRYLDKVETIDAVWESIPLNCPFEVELEPVSNKQRWIVD